MNEGDAVLSNVEDFLGRFVSYPSLHGRVAHVLWIAHAHLMDAWESTPRLAFLSPEPGSGKTRALEITSLLVPRPVEAVNATPAYLFRKIGDEEGRPTILYDEIDTVFGPKAKEHEEIRGVINAGHRRGAVAGRCVIRGKTVETEELPAFAAVALAGLGSLPDTILSRAIVVRMRRRAPTERVESFRRRLHSPEGEIIRTSIEDWTDSIRMAVEDAWPDMPEGVEDRAADCWEPLFAVADAAGGAWPKRARVAAVALLAASSDEKQSLGVRLLSDIREIWLPIEDGVDAMATADLIDRLLALPESPWGDLRGKPLDARRLASLLNAYGIKSRTIRVGSRTPKAYAGEKMRDAWARYLPIPRKSATSETPATTAEFPDSIGGSVLDTCKTRFGSPNLNALNSKDCFGVADVSPFSDMGRGESCPSCGGEGCDWCR